MEMTERKVLVVDDDEGVQRMMCRSVRRIVPGCRIDLAGDGEEGVRQVQENGPYGLIISDLHMPRCGGCEMLEQLRQLGIQTPVLLMSAYGAGLVRRTLAGLTIPTGQVECMGKPVDRDPFVRIVSAALAVV